MAGRRPREGVGGLEACRIGGREPGNRRGKGSVCVGGWVVWCRKSTGLAEEGESHGKTRGEVVTVPVSSRGWGGVREQLGRGCLGSGERPVNLEAPEGPSPPPSCPPLRSLRRCPWTQEGFYPIRWLVPRAPLGREWVVSPLYSVAEGV